MYCVCACVRACVGALPCVKVQCARNATQRSALGVQMNGHCEVVRTACKYAQARRRGVCVAYCTHACVLQLCLCSRLCCTPVVRSIIPSQYLPTPHGAYPVNGMYTCTLNGILLAYHLHVKLQVVLQVRTHSLQVPHYRYLMVAQVLRWPHPGHHQKLRRANAT